MDFSHHQYKRLKTKEVHIGQVQLGAKHAIVAQTMTTPDTMDTEASVAQIVACKKAGAEMVRLTAPSRKEAAHLEVIKKEIIALGQDLPLVADIHFTPNAADIAAQHIEKVRVNPGNYVDKKRFEHIEYTDETYQEELDRIEQRFVPLINICKKHKTAIRIGTNHGSLSDRIMSRYGDTPNGMVESAMEFLRIARAQDFHDIVISMKSSNPQVMVQAYRLLTHTMLDEFGEAYPLHLGVTEAGDGEDGRIKSAVGIGTLLIDGMGDTIRVSLTEDPEYEIPVCRSLAGIIQPNEDYDFWTNEEMLHFLDTLPKDFSRRRTKKAHNIGNGQLPIAAIDFRQKEEIGLEDLKALHYNYNADLDKWNIGDLATDYIWANEVLDIPLPGTLLVGLPVEKWQGQNHENYIPVWTWKEANEHNVYSRLVNVLALPLSNWEEIEKGLKDFKFNDYWVIRLDIQSFDQVYLMKSVLAYLKQNRINVPVIFNYEGRQEDLEASVIAWSAFMGYFLLEGWMDGVSLVYEQGEDVEKLNQIVFSILQATRARISKTEYISCPSCGRTLFDLQETTAKVRARTHHLKGLKIAIMGCIVNGPGEMADADFGYVGSGPGKITLYKNKEVVKRNIDSEVAVEELVNLLKENGVWVEPTE